MKLTRTLGCAAMAGLVLAGCGSGTGDSSGDGKIDGEIVVLTQRTDIVGTVFEKHKQDFNKIHSDVRVKFEANSSVCPSVRTGS